MCVCWPPPYARYYIFEVTGPFLKAGANLELSGDLKIYEEDR